MNWNLMQGNWTYISARAQQRWGRLTDSDVQTVSNQRERLLDRIQMRYGVQKEEAERQVLNWERRVTDAWFCRHVETAQEGVGEDEGVMDIGRPVENSECQTR